MPVRHGRSSADPLRLARRATRRATRSAWRACGSRSCARGLAIAAAIATTIALVCTLSVAGARPLAAREADPPAHAAAARTTVSGALPSVDAAMVVTHVKRLSGAEPLCVDGQCRVLRNRLTGSTDLQWALRYLTAQLEAMGYAVEEVPWVRGAWADRNLRVRKPGAARPDEEVYVVAHVDGVASCADGRCPAADDNASGAVAVLELARLLADREVDRSVVLLFSTGEEQSMLGVRSYVDAMTPSELQRIVALINLDMIGYDGDGDRVMELYHEDHPPSRALAETMSRTIGAADLGLVPRLNPGCG